MSPMKAERKIETKKQRLKRLLSQKTLKPGAISELRRQKERLKQRLFDAIPEQTRTALGITPDIINIVILHAPCPISVLYYPTDGKPGASCIMPAGLTWYKISRLLPVWRNAWKGVIKISAEKINGFARITFTIL